MFLKALTEYFYMNGSLTALFILLVSFSESAYSSLPKANFINTHAEDPQINIWNTPNITQITYSNGDSKNPEFFVMVCDRVTRSMEFQYYIVRNGVQVLNADFFTIQKYPKGWMVMNYPYYPPAKVIYDSGMGLNKGNFGEVLKELTTLEDSEIAITLEVVTDKYGAKTKAWSQLIPVSVFKRDLLNKDISGCLHTDSREMIPLI